MDYSTAVIYPSLIICLSIINLIHEIFLALFSNFITEDFTDLVANYSVTRFEIVYSLIIWFKSTSLLKSNEQPYYWQSFFIIHKHLIYYPVYFSLNFFRLFMCLYLLHYFKILYFCFDVIIEPSHYTNFNIDLFKQTKPPGSQSLSILISSIFTCMLFFIVTEISNNLISAP